MVFGFQRKSKDDVELLTALNKSFAVIEFDTDGKIIMANENFCRTMGYALDEIVGRPHSTFVDAEYARSAEYRDFWARLGRGEAFSSEFRRFGKGGKEIWISASYNPVLGSDGKAYKVVKLATDITQAKMHSIEAEAKLKAISLCMAVVEFSASGEILDANPTFLATMGYALEEVKGRPYKMFLEPNAPASEGQEFGRKLQLGEPFSDVVRRVSKSGRPVLLQAAYNPIKDASGKLVKVIKFAFDLSDLIDLGAGLSRLANNDLSTGIPGEFKHAFANIQRDFNIAREKLQTAISGVADSVEAVSSGAKEIAAASDNLSGRTEQQAASLEETAAALATVTETVRKAADGANEVSRVVASARANAVSGGEVVRKAVDAMDRIEKSSQQIGQIIGVIDEIAFQTNLLALNAGVEAARAGDAGKGFAVVASEVRGLAQRSADAAKEIKNLVSTSTAQVSDGVSLVAQTGTALGQIIEQIEAINAQIGRIASGAQDQATSLNEVNQAVNQMDQGTQQNAAMAEQASAAGQSMLAAAGKLASLISQFKLSQNASGGGLRSELQRVAPHAFAKPVEPPRRTTPAARPAPRKVAAAPVATAAAAAKTDWEEF